MLRLRKFGGIRCKGKSWEVDNSLGQTQGTLFEPSDEEVLIDPELVLELKKKGVKFTEEDLIFVTRDSSGEIVFLEKGNDNAGLKHIINRHAADFKKAYNVDKDSIKSFLFDVVHKGKLVNREIQIVNNITRINKTYKYKDYNIVFLGIGTNGFLVMARPTDSD